MTSKNIPAVWVTKNSHLGELCMRTGSDSKWGERCRCAKLVCHQTLFFFLPLSWKRRIKMAHAADKTCLSEGAIATDCSSPLTACDRCRPCETTSLGPGAHGAATWETGHVAHGGHACVPVGCSASLDLAHRFCQGFPF